MLGMKKYEKKYIAACRARVEANLGAYRKQVGKARSKDFEARYFPDQVLLLDHMFVHGLTGIEGKDGNARDEVRVLCHSILLNQGMLQVDKRAGMPSSAGSGIKLSPEKSVLKLAAGDEIRLSDADFMRLSRAFFEEIAKRYAG